MNDDNSKNKLDMTSGGDTNIGGDVAGRDIIKTVVTIIQNSPNVIVVALVAIVAIFGITALLARPWDSFTNLPSTPPTNIQNNVTQTITTDQNFITPEIATIVPTPQPLPTATHQPMPTITPHPSLGGQWSGTTDQGEAIIFQVGNDSIGSAIYNVTVSYQYPASCPLGRVTFTSFDSGHIFGPPSYEFSLLNIPSNTTNASINGGFTLPNAARGTLEIMDQRSPQERLSQPCPLRVQVAWTANKN